MKHTTDDLLLAAQVRLLAIEFRRFAFVEARKAADLEYKDFNGPAIAYTDEDAQAQVDANAAHEQHLKKNEVFRRRLVRIQFAAELCQASVRGA